MHRQLIKHLSEKHGINLRPQRLKRVLKKAKEPEKIISHKQYIERLRLIIEAVEKGKLKRRDVIENAILFVVLKELQPIKSDKQIAELMGVSTNTIMRLKGILGFEKKKQSSPEKLKSKQSILALAEKLLDEIIQASNLSEGQVLTSKQIAFLRVSLQKALAREHGKTVKAILNIFSRRKISEKELNNLIRKKLNARPHTSFKLNSRIVLIVLQKIFELKEKGVKLSRQSVQQMVLKDLNWKPKTFRTALSKSGLTKEIFEFILEQPEDILKSLNLEKKELMEMKFKKGIDPRLRQKRESKKPTELISSKRIFSFAENVPETRKPVSSKKPSIRRLRDKNAFKTHTELNKLSKNSKRKTETELLREAEQEIRSFPTRLKKFAPHLTNEKINFFMRISNALTDKGKLQLKRAINIFRHIYKGQGLNEKQKIALIEEFFNLINKEYSINYLRRKLVRKLKEIKNVN